MKNYIIKLLGGSTIKEKEQLLLAITGILESLHTNEKEGYIKCGNSFIKKDFLLYCVSFGKLKILQEIREHIDFYKTNPSITP